MKCSLFLDPQTEESLDHLLCCIFLTSKPYLVEDLKSVKVNDIYGSLSKQIRAVKVFLKVFRIYENEKNK